MRSGEIPDVLQQVLASPLRVGRVQPVDLVEAAQGAPHMRHIDPPLGVVVGQVASAPAVRPDLDSRKRLIGEGVDVRAGPLGALGRGRGRHEETVRRCRQ